MPAARSSSKRSTSKLKTLKVDERMLLQLPRLGLATEEQLEYVNKLYSAGGQPGIQALLNLMQSGVLDCLIWNRESWVGDSIGAASGFDGDKLDLMDPVAMPPTGGCNLLYTEGVLESMLDQLQISVEKALCLSCEDTADVVTMAIDVPRQVCLAVQRVRFTAEINRCIRENRQMSTISRAHLELKKKLGDRLMSKEILDDEAREGERATLMAVLQVLHEQGQVLKMLMATKTPEELQQVWNEQMRFSYDDKERVIEIKFGDQVVMMGREYSPPTMLITTDFTHTLRWAYLQAMRDGGTKVLVLIGTEGCGKLGMIINVGQLLGMLPTTIRVSKSTPADELWWSRRLNAAHITGGGQYAPVILSQAHRAKDGVLDMALKVATDLGMALCLTMSPGPEAQQHSKGALSAATIINVPESDLQVIAAGQLAAEGLTESDVLGTSLATVLETLNKECKPQPHYDFGPRTLMQLCAQIGFDRKKGTEEKDIVASVLERCLLPKLVKADVPLLKTLLLKNFKVDRTLVSPSDADDGRWHRVAENIHTITKHEPDCMVLPVPPEDEEAFYQDFCKMLNRNGSASVKMPGLLSDRTPEQLLGTMPGHKKSGEFEKVQDGELVALLRKAMDDHVDPHQLVWIYMMTGNINREVWECLHEMLNDSRCMNLSTGEQLRLTQNLRFLFVMPEAGTTPQDTFSRTAVVYTDPP